MLLQTRGISFSYPGGKDRAVTELSVDLGTGITGLVGVNGAGKSTFLKILARILRVDAGEVSLDGADIGRSRRREIAPRIAFMPQDFRLPPGARVLDSLTYLAWLKGVSAGTAVERSRSTLEAVGLADRSRDRVSSLSGGMVRRLALAQTLVSEPDVILLDEPTTGLDPEQRVMVRELLGDATYRSRITLISSHVMEDLEALAENIVVLDAGRIAFAGTMTEFRTGPDGEVEDAEAAFLRRLLGARR